MQEKLGTSLGPADAHLHALRSYAGTGKPMIDEPEVTSNSRILVLAAHLEDPIIGCGGTICKLAKKGAHIKMLYMTDSCYGADIKPSSEYGVRVRSYSFSVLAANNPVILLS